MKTMHLKFKTLWASLAAGSLVCAANTPTLAEVRLSTVTSRGRVHLLVAQQGDPSLPGILFIHGFAQSYLSFRRQFGSALSAKYHLVAFDLRGHGGSDKPGAVEAYASSKVWADDVAAVIEATGLKRPVIVGWSYGGYVAIDYLRHYGIKNIAGLNLVGSLGGLAEALADTAGDSDAARAMRARSNRKRSLNLLDNIMAGKETAAGYVTSNMTPEDRDILFATEMMMPAYARRFMVSRQLGNADVLKTITIPVLFTRGSKDLTMPPAALAKLLQMLPNAKLSAYEDTGHLPFVEHTDRFNDELAAFVDAVAAR